MRFQQAFTVLFVLLSLSSCDSDEATPLLGGFVSHASPKDVQQKIGTPSWVIVDKGSPTTVGNDQTDYFVAEVSEFSDMGFSGTAQFEFFKNQLVSITFFPAMVNEYMQALEAKGIGFELNNLGVHQAEISPDTEILFYPDSGSFNFADRSLSLTTAKALSGEN